MWNLAPVRLVLPFMSTAAWHFLTSIPLVHFLMAECGQNQGQDEISPRMWGHLSWRTPERMGKRNYVPRPGLQVAFGCHGVGPAWVTLSCGEHHSWVHEGSTRRWRIPKQQLWVSSLHQCIYTLMIHPFLTSHYLGFLLLSDMFEARALRKISIPYTISTSNALRSLASPTFSACK